MKHKITYLLGLLFMVTSLYSQIPEIIPSSPEMHGLGQYGDIPANNYTGVPEISIPLHEVTIGELSLPITLSYHATGIHVTQEASWVGLGWNLVAGGAISYIPVGANDRLVQKPLVLNDFIKVLDYVAPTTFPQVKPEDQFLLWGCTPTDGNRKVTENVALRMLNGYGEQDIYSANFLNHSFKFFKNPRNGSFQFLGQKNNCKISEIGGSNGFSITGEDGTIYLFESIETRSALTGNAHLGYYLTKVIHPSGDEIILKYSRVQVQYIPPLIEYIWKYSIKSPQAPDEAIRNVKASNFITPNYVPYLDTIETKKEWVIFERDNNRVDLKGAAKLKKMVVKDRLTLKEKFSYTFSYSYFTGELRGGNYLTDRSSDSNIAQEFTSDQMQKRLKLDSLVQSNSTNKNKRYAFEYDQSVSLPYKTSFAIDHWGFYNGQINSGALIRNARHTIIPKIASLTLDNPNWVSSIPIELYGLSGATRGASANFITAGVLKKIKYPTGGWTEFDFEPHDFNNRKYISAEDENSYINASYNTIQLASVISFPNYPVYSHLEQEFTISERTLVDFNGRLFEFADPYMTIEGVDVPGGFSTIFFRYDNRTSSPPETRAEWESSFWLQPGIYKLKCHALGQYGSLGQRPLITGSLRTKKFFTEDLSHLPSLGGGIRVKEITNYDDNGAKISSKKYSYMNENGTTSGKLLVPLSYFKNNDIRVGQVGGGGASSSHNSRVELSGSSYISLSGLTYGNNVGYGRVEVELFSRSGEDTNGKEIFYYSNNEATVFLNNISYYGNRTNGDLLRKIILNNANDTVLVEKNSYGIIFGTHSVAMVNGQIVDHYMGPTHYCGGVGGLFNPLAYVGRFRIYAYPFESYCNVLTASEVRHYSSGSIMSIAKSYSYSSNHLQLSNKTQVRSGGNVITDYYYYPEDYPTFGGYNLPDLRSKNIVKPIKVEKTVNGNQTAGNIIAYNKQGQPLQQFVYRSMELKPRIVHNPGTYLPSSDYQSSETWVYDDNRPVLFTAKDGMAHSFYWRYDKPVVVAENVSNWSLVNAAVLNNIPPGYSNIDQFLVDMHDISTNNSKRDIWRNFNSALRNSLGRDAMVTTYTYDAIFGMTSLTDPNGITIYYEYDSFGRLYMIKDQDASIQKIYQYNYKMP